MSFPASGTCRDRGTSAVDYAAILMLVGCIIAGLFASGVVSKTSSAVNTAICRVLAGDCAPPGSTASPPVTGKAPAPTSGRPSPPSKKGGWCKSNWFTTSLCVVASPGVPLVHGAVGVGQGLWDTGKGLWDGVTFVGCLAHICSQKGFESDWGGIKTLFTHPDKALPAIWNDMITHCHKWQTQEVSRCVTDFVGSILGGKGINKLKELSILNKVKNAARGAKDISETGKDAGRAEEAARAARAALVARLQKLADQVGSPTKPFIMGPNRKLELPYRPPPGMVEAGLDHPLDLGKLEPKRYLWIVDDKGDIRLAPEESPAYQGYYANGRTYAKHGDLAADGTASGELGPGGVFRPSARAGGELVPEFGADGRPNGRWELNDDSSYSYSTTRADHVPLNAQNLQALKDMMQAMGTDTSKVDIVNVAR